MGIYVCVLVTYVIYSMIIDMHAHLDQADAFGWTDTPEKLIPLMNGAGIDKTVVTTYADTPGPGDSLEQLRAWIEEYPDRLIGFPRMDPRWSEAVSIFEDAVTEHGMRGLKLHPVSNISNPWSDATVELLDKADELDVPVLFHSGDRILSLPQQIGEAASRTDATLLMGHVGGYFNSREALIAAREHENVVLESSAFPHVRVLQEAVAELGAERVVYGSDMPPANPKVELEKIRVLDLTDEQRADLLWRNAARLLGLDVEGEVA
ncbi:MAG: amidohydrolase family protein [Halorhabdus sp.]